MKQTVCIDNGSQWIRSQYGQERRQWANSKFIKKDSGEVRVCDEVEVEEEAECNVVNCMTRGVLTRLDSQTAIWERLFQYWGIQINSQNEHHLIITLQLLTPLDILDKVIQIFLEYYCFQSICIVNPQFCIAQLLPAGPQLLVDSSHSATYIVPVLDQMLCNEVVRLDLGGKLLTNYLKDLVSYKYLDLKRLFFQSQHVKHSLLSHPGGSGPTAYVFGDRLDTGYIETRPEALLQIPPSNKITFDQEASFLKDLFFQPQNIGIQQGGVHLAIKQAVDRMPVHLHPSLYSNLRLSGGNFNIPGLEGMLQQNLRQEVECSMEVKTDAGLVKGEGVLQGLEQMRDHPEIYGDMQISKGEYYELGAYRVTKVFQFI